MSAFHVVTRRIKGRKNSQYNVVRGAQVLATYASLRAADEAIDRMKKAASPKLRDRACITCGDTFRSEHAGHRMCTGCRSSATLSNQFYG